MVRSGTNRRSERGSVFNLRLALTEEHAAVTKTRLGICTAKAGSKVVLASNSDAIAFALDHIATAMELSVVWGSTGERALAAIQEQKPDAIIVDQTMSDLDFRSLANMVRKAGFTRGPILIGIDEHPVRGTRRSDSTIKWDTTLPRPFGIELFNVLQAKVVRAAPLPANTKTAAAVANVAGPLRILMAEDNAPNQMVASALLRSAGYSLEIARDGIEAVERATAQHFDVILMDVQMPRADGITATRQIRTVDRLRNVPIIGLSAGAMKKDRDNCIEAGMSDYLSKPIDWDKLLSLLSDIEKALKKSSMNAA